MPSSSSNTHPLATVARLAIGPALGLGIARFGYALILPAMKSDLGWSFAMSGFINTVNALGYLAGALLSGWMNRRFRSEQVFSIGIVVTIIAIFGPGLTANLAAISLFRFLAGYGGAMAFIAGGAMAAGLARHYSGRSGFLIGMFYAGPGFGIALSGLVVPSLMDVTGPAGWHWLWFALGAMSLVLGLPALGMKGLESALPAASAQTPAPMPTSRILPILAAYVLFGAGSIAYMTFMFTFLAQEGRGTFVLSSFWVLIGVAVMASPWIWGRLMTNLKAGKAFATLCAINGVGAALPLVSASAWAIILSAIVFGCSFLSVVASTTAFVHRNAPSGAYARGIALFAVAFGLGQTAGPLVSGTVTDAFHSLPAGLLTGVVLIAIAALCGLTQKDVGP